MKRVLAMFLCAAMLFGTVDTTVLAAETETQMEVEALVSGGDAESISGNDWIDGQVSGNEQDTEVLPEEQPEGSVTPEYDVVSTGEDVSGNDTEQENTPYTIVDGVLTSWESAAGKIQIPSGVTAIGDKAFLGNTEVTEVTISEGVVTIGAEAFKGCTSLQVVRLPKTVQRIGNGSFMNDTDLYMVYLQEPDYSALDTIGDSAFANCPKLSIFLTKGSFIIPDSITSIGSYAFEGNLEITRITLPKKLAAMGEGVFKDCQNLMNVTLSANFTQIPAKTFYGCYDLTTINWNDTKEIGTEAFANCEALNVLTLPATVKKVMDKAFNGCTEMSFVLVNNAETQFTGEVFDEHNIILCAESETSEACYYATKYPYLTFKTLAAARKGTYSINYAQIKKAQPGVTVYCYTVSVVDGVEQKQEVRDKIKVGQRVYVEIQNIPANYCLLASTLCVNGERLQRDATIKDRDVYYFIQKTGDSVLTAKFGKLTYEDTLGKVTYSTSEPIEDGMKIGQTVYLYLQSNKTSLEKPLNGSRFSFEGYNKKKLTVAVDDAGKISLTARAAGKETVIVYNKYNPNGTNDKVKVLEFEVEIKSTKLADMDLHIVDNSKHITIGTTEADETKTKNVEILTKYVIQGASFKVNANGWDETGVALNAAYTWSTSDASIAKLAKTATTVADTSNIITIPKGAEGEATILVEAKDGSELKRAIHITVKDNKPSVRFQTAAFNSNKTKPLVISLVEAYGAAVDPASVKLSDLDAQGKVISGTSKVFAIAPDKTAGDYVISSKSGDPVAEGSYAVALNLYAGEEPYYINLTITVKNTLPAAKVKQTGKINLFNRVDGDSQSVATVISGYGSEKIAGYGLINLTDPKGNKTDLQKDYNKFSENFRVDADGLIWRKAESMGIYETGNVKGKVVATGYLAIYFEGYKEPQRVKITVGCESRKPAYVLRNGTQTYSVSRANPVNEFSLEVCEKTGTKQNVLTTIELDDTYKVEQNVIKSTGMFATDMPELSIENGRIKVSNAQISGKGGKLVINLTSDSRWGQDCVVELTYTVKVSTALPKASLGSAKVTLNSIYDGQQAAFTLKTNQSDCPVSEKQIFTPVYGKKDAYNAEIDKLVVTYEDGAGLVKIPDGVTIADGTYKFTCNVAVDDDYYVKSDVKNTLNKVVLSVVVKNLKPSMVWKSTKFQMNLEVCGKESVSQSFTFKNAPAEGSGYEVTAFKILSGNEDIVIFDMMENAVIATLDEQQRIATGTYTYKVCPVWTKEQDGVIKDEVEGQASTLQLIVKALPISVSLGAAKGSIDLLNRKGSSVAYAINVKNAKDTMQQPKLYEVSKTGVVDKEESERFTATVENGKLVIRAEEDADITCGATYSLRLSYWRGTDDKDGKARHIDKLLKIKPVQKFPGILQDKKAVTLYQSNKEFGDTITIQAKAKSTATITGVKWAKGVDPKLQQSFHLEVIEQDAENNTVTIKITTDRNYRYPVGKTQTLKFTVVCEGQDANTYGTAFSVKATVNR